MSASKPDNQSEADPRHWRPVSLEDKDPGSFAYLSIESISGEEVVGTVYRWPRVRNDGRLELKRHCGLRAVGPGSFSLTKDRLVNRNQSFLESIPIGNFGDPVLKLKPGEIVAVMTAGEDFWASSAEPVDWGKLSLPLIEITNEAREAEGARFEPFAWTLWRDWMGHAPLIAHFARVASRQLSTIDGPKPQISIQVRVKDDVEEFSTPEEYLSSSTPEGRDKPDSLLLRCVSGQLWISLNVARRRDRERAWLENAVLLEVGSPRPADLEHVVEAHERMAAAVRRGEPDWGAEGSRASMVGFRPLDEEGQPKEIPEAWHAKAERRASRIALILVGLISGLLAASSEFGWVGILVLGTVGGLFAVAVLTVWPGVEFTSRRSERIVSLAAKGLAGPLLGAGIAAAVRILSE